MKLWKARKKGRAAIARFAACESGATAVEYALVVTLIMFGMIAAFTRMTTNMGNMFNRLSNNLT